ncbi:MAG: histidinol dehydrogenase [Actinomycetota bacterium]|jgi:histidinol dehydrogenase|nr:histidinol dehydrogenase [Actinomycetota bacterium]
MLELIDGREQATPVHISRPQPVAGAADPVEVVRGIIDEVRLKGDEALIEMTARFDGPQLTVEELRVPEATITKARSLVRPELIDALEVMSERLRRTCEHQAPKEWFDRSVGDEVVGELIRPLRRVGVYVPGGRAAYPSTVIMATIPAQVAGVGQIAVASPPDGRGEVSEAVLAACSIAGITEVYRIGGAQAIAALAYGTTSVRPVDKIVGPGNIYVTLAKRAVQGWVGIDSEAGPTEIAIVADETASAEVVAADLVAQAEHGPLGTHALITWVPELAERVMALLELEVARHEHPEELENTLIEGGRAVLVRDRDHALDTANAFAPEHLELIFEGAWESLDRVRNAGSVFVGPNTPVPVGDYVGGTNHVLPSGGTARYESGLGVQDFTKRIYVSSLERSALERMAPHVEALAEAEGLFGHARAIERRLES